MSWATPSAWSGSTTVNDPEGAFAQPTAGAVTPQQAGNPPYNWNIDPSKGWYDPNQLWGGAGPSPNTGMDQIPQLSDYLQRMNWQIAYDYATQGAGLNTRGAFANYARSQQDILQRAYNAALVSNTNLTPQQFLSGYGGPEGLMGQMRQQFQTLPYQLRGEDPRAYGQGTMGWVPRL